MVLEDQGRGADSLMEPKRWWERNRFVVFVAITLAFIASILKTIWAAYPIVEFLGFLAPVTIGTYGIKSYRDVKETSYNVNSNCKDPTAPPMV